MQRSLTRPGYFAALTAAVALIAVAFVAHADEAEGLHPRHHTLVEMLGGKGGFLGVQLTEITPELRVHFGAPEDAGVLVSKVVSDSPAQRAGLRVGDIITRFAGEDVDSAPRLQRLVRRLEDGTAADIEVWRDGGVETLTADIEVREGRGFGLPRAFALSCEDEEDCELGFSRFRPGLPGAFAFSCEGDEECDFDFGSLHLDLHGGSELHLSCGDSEDCDFSVKCEGGDCECTANGEATDCGDMSRFRRLHEH